VTVNIQILWAKLEPSTLMGTKPLFQSASYKDFRTLLFNDGANTGVDKQVKDSLPKGDSFRLLVNYVRNLKNAGGKKEPYVDEDTSLNNRTLLLTNANAKAIGYKIDPKKSPTDGTITISNDDHWDYDPSDGVMRDKFDFVGTFVHEIGHVLGFDSGIDTLIRNIRITEAKQNKPFDDLFDNLFVSVRPLDLFRYSLASTEFGVNKYKEAVPDFTVNFVKKTFSVTKGVIDIAEFARGTLEPVGERGDGFQADHWFHGTVDEKVAPPDPLIGVMSARAGEGKNVIDRISDADKKAFDAIGWDL